MKTLQTVFFTLILTLCNISIWSQSNLEDRDKERQSGLIKTNQKKQEEILQKDSC